MIMYYAWVDGSRFTFSALGTTATQAINAVMLAWRAHVRGTGADPEYIVRDDIQVLAMRVGQGYVDNDRKLGRPALSTAERDAERVIA
jgi:hypothetical protein